MNFGGCLMSDGKSQSQLRLIPCGDDLAELQIDSAPKPPAINLMDNPLLRQLTALADAIDRDVEAILGL
jgi:hypothetical protein